MVVPARPGAQAAALAPEVRLGYQALTRPEAARVALVRSAPDWVV